MTDITILKSLAERADMDRENRRATARTFATLYSAVIQRYLLDDGSLKDTNKANLVSVIVQSEKLVNQFVSDWQGTLKRAIEKGGGAGLLTEHDVLFGTASTPGKMPNLVGFDYGKNADGSARNFPPAMQKPPKPQ
jgi:hypothetical protein